MLGDAAALWASYHSLRQSTEHVWRQALREAPNLTRLVVTPLGALPALAVLDLTACPKLGYLFLQCASLHTLVLDGCMALTKVWRCLCTAPCCTLFLRLETYSSCAYQQCVPAGWQS